MYRHRAVLGVACLGAKNHLSFSEYGRYPPKMKKWSARLLYKSLSCFQDWRGRHCSEVLVGSPHVECLHYGLYHWSSGVPLEQNVTWLLRYPFQTPVFFQFLIACVFTGLPLRTSPGVLILKRAMCKTRHFGTAWILHTEIKESQEGVNGDTSLGYISISRVGRPGVTLVQWALDPAFAISSWWFTPGESLSF